MRVVCTWDTSVVGAPDLTRVDHHICVFLANMLNQTLFLQVPDGHTRYRAVDFE